jgi:membrane complex biogenesis BtpA family protein
VGQASWLEEVFKAGKPIIGVVHLKPLPGSPLYAGGFEEVVEVALSDAQALIEGGVDGVLVENYGDRPFRAGRVGVEAVAAMAVAVREVAKHVDRPVGVNVLRSDGPAAMAVAAATGARFIRVNVYVGVAATDQGVVQGCADEVARLRAKLRADVKVMADVSVKHARQLAYAGPVEEALDAVERGLADAVIVTGPRTGLPPAPAEVAEVKEAVGAIPVLVGSGVNPWNVAELLKVADGCIVGSYFRRGRLDLPVDVGRVKELVEAASKAS